MKVLAKVIRKEQVMGGEGVSGGIGRYWSMPVLGKLGQGRIRVGALCTKLRSIERWGDFHPS